MPSIHHLQKPMMAEKQPHVARAKTQMITTNKPTAELEGSPNGGLRTSSMSVIALSCVIVTSEVALKLRGENSSCRGKKKKKRTKKERE